LALNEVFDGRGYATQAQIDNSCLSTSQR